MKKIKYYFLLIVSLLSLTISLVGNTVTINKADISEWVLCDAPWGEDAKDVMGFLQQVRSTEVLPYIMSSKSAIATSEIGGNTINNILEISGYKFGDKAKASTKSPFDQFGFRGLSYSSYIGEWKYYSIDACKSAKSNTKSSNYGEFYKGRKDPLVTYSERGSSKDPRVAQTAMNKYILSFKNLMANISLNITKIFVAITLALIGLTFGDIADFLGITETYTNSVFTSLYNNLFIPFIGIMMILSAIYVIYKGLIKREYRQSLIEGVAIPLGVMLFSFIFMGYKDVITIPNKIATFAQTIVISTLGHTVTSKGADDLCNSTVGLEGIRDSKTLLNSAGDSMRSMLGCRIWKDFVFEPWVKGQWNTDYNKLNKLSNINSKWVGEPKVKLGKNTITNWALLQLSVQSGLHTPVDGNWSAYINGLDKDWYRIVDALSNYDEKVIAYSSGGGSSDSSSSGNIGSGSSGNKNWLKEGTQAYKNAKDVFDFWVSKGLSGKAAAGILGWVNSEGGFEIVGRAQGCYGQGIECSLKSGKKPVTGGTSNTPGGGGIYQFDPYYKYAPLGSDDWENAKKMSSFVLKSIASGAWNPSYDGSGKRHSFSQFARLTDITDASLAWGAYEIPNYAYVKKHEKVSDGKAADRVFNKENIPFDEAKFKKAFSSSGGLATGTRTSDGGSSDEFGEVTIVEQVESKPLEQWKYWTGNIQGNRITQALLSLVFSILGLTAPLVLSIISGVYGVGLTLVTMVAPIFLLLGLWGGKGKGILMNYLGLLLSTIYKKVIASFLVVLSIMFTSNLMDMVNEIGLIQVLVYMGIISAVLIKKQDEILNTIGRVNLGTINFDGFKKSLQFMGRSANKAGKLGLTYGAGYLGAKSLGAEGKEAREAAKSGASSYIRSQLATTETGRRANSIYESKRKNIGKGKNNVFNPHEKYGQHICAKAGCGRLLKEGETVYIDEMGNYYCQTCEEREFTWKDNHRQTILDNSHENEEVSAPKNVTLLYKGNEIKGNNQIGYKEIIQAGVNREDKDINLEKINKLAKQSMAKAINDSKFIKEQRDKALNEGRDIRFKEPDIPEFLDNYIDLKALQDIKQGNSSNTDFSEIIKEAWINWYKDYITTDDTQIEEFSKSIEITNFTYE